MEQVFHSTNKRKSFTTSRLEVKVKLRLGAGYPAANTTREAAPMIDALHIWMIAQRRVVPEGIGCSLGTLGTAADDE